MTVIFFFWKQYSKRPPIHTHVSGIKFYKGHIVSKKLKKQGHHMELIFWHTENNGNWPKWLWFIANYLSWPFNYTEILILFNSPLPATKNKNSCCRCWFPWNPQKKWNFVMLLRSNEILNKNILKLSLKFAYERSKTKNLKFGVNGMGFFIIKFSFKTKFS